MGKAPRFYASVLFGSNSTSHVILHRDNGSPFLSLSLSFLSLKKLRIACSNKQEVGDGVKPGDRKKLGNLSFIVIYVLKYYCYKPWHSLDP